MPAQLISLNDGASILLDKPILLIGRHPECDIQIDSRKISRKHCCIAQVDDHLVVRDLGSTNGIRINGVRVLEGRLKAGDELTIGGSRFRLSWDAPSDAHLPLEETSRRREEIIPSARRPGGPADGALESCDEPVALAEADDDDDVPMAIPVAIPQAAHAARAGPGLPHSVLDSDEPLIPDAPKLAPGSNPDAERNAAPGQ
jgi:predicted component of type VI protein secretion system